MKVPVPPHAHLMLSVFNFSHSGGGVLKSPECLLALLVSFFGKVPVQVSDHFSY